MNWKFWTWPAWIRQLEARLLAAEKELVQLRAAKRTTIKH